MIKFYDQKSATVRTTAEGVAEAIFGELKSSSSSEGFDEE